VSTKQTPNLKQYLKIGSIAFGASFVWTLPFTLNLSQSALIGLATLPGAIAGMMVRSRHHQQQGQRQLERGKLRLQQLQQRGTILNHQLQSKHQDRQEIELRVSQLHDLVANLTDRIDRDNNRHQQLEQQLATLTLYCQGQENIAANLDRKIQDKQAYLLEVDTNLNNLKLELAQLPLAQIHVKDTRVDEDSALVQQKTALTDIQHQINLCLATKQELELHIQQLHERKMVETEDFDQSISQKYSLLEQLDLAISDRQKAHSETVIEVDRLNSLIAEKAPELIAQSQQLVEIKLELSATALALESKQAELAELAIGQSIEDPAGSTYTTEKELDPLSDRLLQRELKIAQLELSSRQAELDNLEFKLQKKLESIGEIDLAASCHAFEPQPPTVDRNIVEIVCLDEWYDKFIDNPHLTVLKHIEKHGTITESEASKKLGNARSVRQFANKLEEYAQDLPFSIRVESSSKGNRYLREDRN
jgi:chromosome segregation ATPase